MEFLISIEHKILLASVTKCYNFVLFKLGSQWGCAYQPSSNYSSYLCRKNDFSVILLFSNLYAKHRLVILAHCHPYCMADCFLLGPRHVGPILKPTPACWGMLLLCVYRLHRTVLVAEGLNPALLQDKFGMHGNWSWLSVKLWKSG